MGTPPQPRRAVSSAAGERDPNAAFRGFSRAFDRFSQAVRHARGRISTEGDLELTLSQYHLLEALQGHATLPVGRMAEAAGVAAPTATRMLDSLERAGTVRRSHSSDDRRVVEVALTDEGLRLVRNKRRAVERARRAMFESLEPGEREHAERLLSRLADAMDEVA